MPLKDLVILGPAPSPHWSSRRGRRKSLDQSVPKRTYRKRAHSAEPQTIDLSTWYFETRRGLEFVHEVRSPEGAFLHSYQFLVPWRKVRASLKRHELQSSPAEE